MDANKPAKPARQVNETECSLSAKNDELDTNEYNNLHEAAPSLTQTKCKCGVGFPL